ncbi:MAG TPA: ABC transporter permease [bacterium]|nr:ABC transporter permease [bacterium]
MPHVIRRFFELIPTLILVSLLVFGLMRVRGDDPVVIMLGPDATPELVAEVRKELGLDLPLAVQYARWMWGVLRGDLGLSLRTRERIIVMIAERASTTIYIALTATVFASVVGLLLGFYSAARRNSLVDHGIMIGAILGLSVPPYLLALLLILAFGVYWQLFPIAAFSVDLAREPLIAMRNLIMPMLSLGIGYSGLTARLARSSLLEVLGADYIRTARGKGLSNRRVMYKHALRNALIPVITIATVNFVHLLAGAIIIEEIFGLPGVGALLIRSIFMRDFPVVQGVTLILSLLFMLGSLASDFIYTVIDPRIRYQ